MPYWPYSSLPCLPIVRRKSHIATWFLNVPPHAFLVYVHINLRTGNAYVGQTSQAPTERPWKHHTDTRVSTDSATFHHMLLMTDIAGWVTIPVQYGPILLKPGWRNALGGWTGNVRLLMISPREF